MSAENNKNNINNAIHILSTNKEQGRMKKLLSFLKGQPQVSEQELRVEPTMDAFQLAFNFDAPIPQEIQEKKEKKISSMQYVEQPDLFGDVAQRLSLTHDELVAISQYQGLDKPIVSISFKQKATDKLIKFKNMIAHGLINHTENYVETKQEQHTENLWYRTAYQTGLWVHNIKVTTKPLFDASLKSMTELAKKVGVHMSTQTETLKTNLHEGQEKLAQKSDGIKQNATSFVQSLQNLKSKITFSGEAKKVNKFQKSFSYILNAMGFEAGELVGDKKKENYITPKQVEENVINELAEYKFFIKEGKLLNSFLENVPDETAASTIYSVLWPALAKKIKDTMNFYQEVSQVARKNMYLHMLESFATKNNLNMESVSHIMESDKTAFVKFFGDKKDVDKIIKNFDNISESIIKYNELAKNNNIRMNHLLKATEDLKDSINSLQLDDNRKSQLVKAIDETQIIRLDNKKVITYDMVRKNVIETNKVMGQKMKV